MIRTRSAGRPSKAAECEPPAHLAPAGIGLDLLMVLWPSAVELALATPQADDAADCAALAVAVFDVGSCTSAQRPDATEVW